MYFEKVHIVVYLFVGLNILCAFSCSLVSYSANFKLGTTHEGGILVDFKWTGITTIITAHAHSHAISGKITVLC